MVRLTSAQLVERGLRPNTSGEILKFIGILVLATRYVFGSRAKLWATKPRSKYPMAPAFGARTGMSRCRFDSLWSCLTCSQQGVRQPDAEAAL